MSEKPLVWIGSSLEDVRSFPPDAKRRAGYQLRRVQSGLMPDDWKPMRTIGPGVNEIRIHSGFEARVLYVAQHAEAVYVLHAFAKRSQKTSQGDVGIARKRLRDLVAHRAGRE